jgi:heat shock protein HtpX
VSLVSTAGKPGPGASASESEAGETFGWTSTTGARRAQTLSRKETSEHMNISATRFATKARTWLLIAGLTALLIVIGSLLGGAFLYLFVGLAIAMNVFGYWFSDRLALRASKAQPVEPGTMPELEAMVQDLAVRAQVPLPRLYTIPSEQPNAFATGRNPQHAAVAVTEGLLQHLPPDQVKGVIAHEFGHIKNRDILVMSIAAMVSGAIAAIANIMQFSLIFGGDDDDSPLGFIGTLAAIIIAPLAATLLQLAVSRQREYLADATGAQLLGQAKPLADGLETLERGAQALPMTHLNPAEASLYAVNPLPRGGVSSLFMTHPPIAERIRRLRALDGETAVRLVA